MSGAHTPNHARKRQTLRLVPTALLLMALLAAVSASAVTHRGQGWAVHYNLPDNDTSLQTSSDPDEWAIRESLLAMIQNLKRGDSATLATFTLSGNSDACGAAGPILRAVNNALNAGASVSFIASRLVDPNQSFGSNNSLSALQKRRTSPLVLSRDTSPSGIMHHKFALFRYAPNIYWTHVTSWNFTGGASSLQWNIALAIEGESLYSAYNAEARELLAGRFGNDRSKSRRHDRSRFILSDSWGENYVRFAPYRAGGRSDGAVDDIVQFIDAAEESIFFALNKLTREQIAEAFIRAVNRGVIVHGVIPASDSGRGKPSYRPYRMLTNSKSYTSANRVKMHKALVSAHARKRDTGEQDLVHTKYMVVDPFGRRPAVVHGSANWTAGALGANASNDESVMFIRHEGISRAFYSNFCAIAGVSHSDLLP